MREREARDLHAYHDGEASWLRRWRVRRLLAKSPDARRELALLSEVGSLIREGDAEAAAPDLWPEIRARLPRAAPPMAAEAERAWIAGWIRWAAPALAAAAAALALTFGLEWGDASTARSVRWLDAEGKSAIVLQDDREATIIWVLEAPGRVSGRTARGLI